MLFAFRFGYLNNSSAAWTIGAESSRTCRIVQKPSGALSSLASR
jgi:hypothetical protein